MATGDAVPREAWRTQGKGKEEEGTGSEVRRQRWCHHEGKIMGNSDGAEGAPRQRAWDKDGDGGATAPLHAAAGAVHGGRGDNVRGSHRGGISDYARRRCTRRHGGCSSTIRGGGGDQGGGSGPRAFLGLTDLTHLAGLVPDYQGVDSLANRENWGESLDDTTDGMAGGGEDGLPHQRR